MITSSSHIRTIAIAEYIFIYVRSYIHRHRAKTVQHEKFQEGLSSDRPWNYSLKERLSDNFLIKRVYEQDSIYFDSEFHNVRYDMYKI